MAGKAYISEYGNWGADEILVIDQTDLTSEQWNNLDILPDYDKLPYAKAILAGEDLTEWEE